MKEREKERIKKEKEINFTVNIKIKTCKGTKRTF